MDISEMIVGSGTNASTSIEENAIPQNLDTPDDDALDHQPDMAAGNQPDMPAGEMTAVERIRAYREGTLSPPTIGGDDSGHNSGNDTDEQTGDGESDRAGFPGLDRDDSAHEESTGEPERNGGGSSPADNSSSGTSRVPRKALLIGVPVAILLVAGVAIPGLGGGSEPSDTAASVMSQSAAGALKPTSTTAPAVVPDGVIAPAKVEAAEYPISLTPPTDAFSGDTNKAWVCAGLAGTVLTITLPAPMIVTEIGVVPGFAGVDKDGAEQWAKHRIVTKVAYYLDYGGPVYADFANKRERQTTPLGSADQPAVTQTIRMVILQTQDVSGQAATAGTDSSAAPAPGLLGDLGSLGLAPSPVAAPGQGSGPATFAVGSIEIIGRSVAR
ncbi:putative uncharacterized protein [Mycolicibacterium novocastrense]|uniref:Uncharacterized protein n=2 Tax=Mycolicibacterium novocastrense TaxID=59813 RepID=A0ABQ0KEA1_MYCNV|nr:putative uncharacterized protein [Mycolicibacterium novocastrense]